MGEEVNLYDLALQVYVDDEDYKVSQYDFEDLPLIVQLVVRRLDYAHKYSMESAINVLRMEIRTLKDIVDAIEEAVYGT